VNRIFSPHGDGWPTFPKRSYGKLDQIEPLDPTNASQAVFCVDVVDADWPGFDNGGLFDLNNLPGLQSTFSDYWNLLFSGRAPPVDPYDDVPIYRIEITAEPGDPWFKELLTLGEDEWILVELDDTGSFEIDVYGALLAAPVFAHLKRIQRNIPQSAALNTAFSPAFWPDATKADLTAPLAKLPPLEYLIGLDVGQGTAVGLADANEDIQLYFDLGGGVYRNAKTRPTSLMFCWRIDAPIVLSHWDSDHWAAEITDPHAQPRTWIAPRQSMSKKHIAFANRILRSGGKLLIWGASPASISVTVGGTQTVDLRRCTGPATSRNGSGIAATVEHSGNQWLLTGDAGYHEVGTLPTSPVAIVVPHHGADMGTSSVPPSRSAGYARLFYSFGPGNRHGRKKPGVQHPTSAAVTAHATWSHGSWSSATPGHSMAGADVLASAAHPGTHLDGVAIGWSSAPPVPLSRFTCALSDASAVCTCTGTMPQA
jgi:beta-lactamase superfamily II metal-dependent hydrolase